MGVVTPEDTTRAAQLTARLSNVEQCLREARAPDVRAFLLGIQEELVAELAALQRPRPRPYVLHGSARRRSADVIPMFPPEEDGPGRCA
jgi:hypothetical protein